MNIPLNFRAQIEGLTGGAWISQALMGVITAVSARWDVQHNDDGSHAPLTIGSAAGPRITTGTGSPEGAVTAPMGSLYLRIDGGASTSLYVKTTGSANTGWTAK